MPEAAQSTQPTSSGAQPGTFIDPYRAYNFKLQIQGVTEGHFTQCSGLEVERYDSDSLHGEFGRPFRLIDSLKELHQTPSGTTQQFLYCFCRVE